MGMASDDQIGSGINIPLGQNSLIIFRCFAAFNSPVKKDNDVIIPVIGGSDGFIQSGRIIGLEQAGARCPCIPAFGRGDTSRGKDGKGLSFDLAHNRCGSFVYIVPAAHIGDLRISVITKDGIVALDNNVDVADLDNHGARPEVVEAFVHGE